jgi:hypothetical protein
MPGEPELPHQATMLAAPRSLQPFEILQHSHASDVIGTASYITTIYDPNPIVPAMLFVHKMTSRRHALRLHLLISKFERGSAPFPGAFPPSASLGSP